ncbi:RodZ domain-containing protein [Solimonas soli]|uniref:RodZ domain-containing protein n=1 Tax=Solimonas soli TaxID=413479 RepID=UPI0009FFC4F9|nr:RodZ domain-containing protein [Solimonas soli]
MSTEPTDPPVPAPAPVPAAAAAAASEVTPGAMIREARQAAHLSVDDLAAHTKLARATVEALERDDFGALLEPVYVRGYYRKCAKVLNLNEKMLIDAYAARVTQKPPQAPAKLRLASGTELGSSSRLPTAMGVLFVLVAIAVCAALWWLRGATTPVPKMISSEVLGGSLSGASAPSAPSPTPVEGGDAAPVETLPSAPSAAAPTTATTPAEEAPANATPAAAPATAPAGSGPLLISFSGQSWIRVLDANGRTLLNGLVGAGERRQLDGKPPFDLFIGAAPVVVVSYEGKTVDLKPYTRDNATARLTLPLGAPSP